MPAGLQIEHYRSLISQGKIESLNSVLFHSEGPLKRLLLAGKDIHSAADWHVAVHEIREIDSDLQRDYCQPHAHNCNELNLILSMQRLVFRIGLGDEEYIVEAPASIYIPAGLLHSANVIEGSGFFIAIVGCGDYASTIMNASETPHP